MKMSHETACPFLDESNRLTEEKEIIINAEGKEYEICDFCYNYNIE